jgi:Rrf2 family protein
MLKLTKKADYGLIAVRHLAEHADLGACSAKDLAEMYGIPQEALAKILQQLVKSKLLVSQHGTNGGYVLSRDPRQISALEVIRAIEGAPFMTSCRSSKGCGTSLKCTVREPLQKVGRAIESVLANLSVWELQDGGEPTSAEDGRYGAPSGTPHSATAGGCGPTAGAQVNSPTQANRGLPPQQANHRLAGDPGLEWATRTEAARTEDELVKIEVKRGNFTGGDFGGGNYGK